MVDVDGGGFPPNLNPSPNFCLTAGADWTVSRGVMGVALLVGRSSSSSWVPSSDIDCTGVVPERGKYIERLREWMREWRRVWARVTDWGGCCAKGGPTVDGGSRGSGVEIEEVRGGVAG